MLRIFIVVCLLCLLPEQVFSVSLVPYRLTSGKWVLHDRDLKTHTEGEFNSLTACSGPVIIAQRDDQWSLIGSNGDVLIPFGAYRKIREMSNGCIEACGKELIDLYSRTGQRLGKRSYQWIELFRDHPQKLVVKTAEGKVGIVNTDNPDTEERIFDFAPVHLDKEHIRIRVNKNGEERQGVCDNQFREIVPSVYDEAGVFRWRYYYGWNRGGDMNIFDKSGKLIWKGKAGNEPQTIYPDFFIYSIDGDEDLVRVESRKTGDAILCDDHDIYVEEKQLFICSYKGNSVMFFSNGKKKTFPNTSFSRMRSDEYFIAREGKGNSSTGKTALIDCNGTKILDYEQRQIAELNETFLVSTHVTSERKRNFSLINIKSGKTIIGPTPDEIHLLGERLYCITNGGTTKIYTLNGNKLQGEFDGVTAHDMVNQAIGYNTAFVVHKAVFSGAKENKKYLKGLIGSDGRMVISVEFDEIRPLENRYDNARKTPRLVATKINEHDNRIRVSVLLDEKLKILTQQPASHFYVLHSDYICFGN
ncbi:MAG TPA: WG repeat-containing protein, partial [Flavobacteriales bacterium]|nr:WG repeat-containing protein [Flavobacteriales bacterium]